MNISAIKGEVRRALSRGETVSTEIDALVERAFSEISALDSFKILYAEYKEPLAFLKIEPYAEFLKNAGGYYLIAATLGVEVDRIIRRLSLTDAAYMSVFNATAAVYLEYMCEQFKRENLGEVSYTFCPGYGGSLLSDIDFIFEEIHPERIGITRTGWGLMLPEKSIVGIVAKGRGNAPRCDGCIKREECKLRKAGKLCFLRIE